MSDNRAQEFLDRLHDIGLAGAFEPTANPKEQKDIIKLVKQKLRLVQQDINREIKEIKARWDGRNSYEALRERDELAPFEVLNLLVSQIAVNLTELENSVQHDKPLPNRLWFESTLAQDMEGKWLVVSERDAEILSLRQELALYHRHGERVKQETEALTKKQRSYEGMGFQFLLYAIFAVIFFILGAFALSSKQYQSTIYWLPAMLGSGIAAVWALQQRKHKRQHIELQLQELQQQFQYLKQLYREKQGRLKAISQQ